MLDSSRDQQRLLPARAFPAARLRKSPVQSPALSIPSGDQPLWQGGKKGLFGEKPQGSLAENSLAHGKGWAELLGTLKMAAGRNGEERGCTATLGSPARWWLFSCYRAAPGPHAEAA